MVDATAGLNRERVVSTITCGGQALTPRVSSDPGDGSCILLLSDLRHEVEEAKRGV